MTKMTIPQIDIDIEKANAEEKLRQIKASFDQNEKHKAQWNIIRLIMGVFAIIMLATVLIISFYILLYNEKFPSAVVISAGSALFIDILGLLISVWKFVLDPKFITELKPNM